MLAKLNLYLNANYTNLLSRGVFAVAGGFLFTALITNLLGATLPFERPHAVMTAYLLSFLLYTVIATWAFCCQSIWRHWIYLLVLCAATAGMLLII